VPFYLGEPKAYHELRTAFEQICAEGPLTTVDCALSSETARLWPGFALYYEPQIVDDYLRRRVSAHPPLFQVASANVLFPAYFAGLKKYRRKELPEDALMAFLWLMRVSLCTDRAAQGFIVDFAPSARDNLELWAQQWGRLLVIEEEWNYFVGAFDLRPPLVSLQVEEYWTVWRGCVYPRRKATFLARELLSRAMPFAHEASGAKLLVVHCNDRRSVKSLRVADELIATVEPEGLETQFRNRMFSQRDQDAEKKIQILINARRMGKSHPEVARAWLKAGLVEPENMTREEALQDSDALESVTAQVKRLWRKLKGWLNLPDFCSLPQRVCERYYGPRSRDRGFFVCAVTGRPASCPPPAGMAPTTRGAPSLLPGRFLHETEEPGTAICRSSAGARSEPRPCRCPPAALTPLPAAPRAGAAAAVVPARAADGRRV
jgi:hypothetical protein